MRNIAGSPVEGDNFYAREGDVARLREILANDDILLLGPRRIGKTSIARAIMARVRSEGWRAIEINVASCQDERGFLDKLDSGLRPELASLTDKAKAAMGDAFEAVGKRIKSMKVSIPGGGAVDLGLGGNDAEDWTGVANDLLRMIAQTNEPWLIYVDELPILLFNIIRADAKSGVQRVRRFLDWFRNDVRAIPEARTVRWLVSGSVGLDTLVHQHGMADTINSMKHEGLEAFTDEVAVGMLGELAANYEIALADDDARGIIAAVLWAQPYYLQLAFHHLRSLLTAAPVAKVGDLLPQAIEKMVLPGADNDFHHWEQRLRIQLPNADADHCMALLRIAAQTAEGARADNLFAELQQRMPDVTADEAMRTFVNLRDILQRDAYWWPDETSGQKRYRFRLEPLRLWWLRRNSL